MLSNGLAQNTASNSVGTRQRIRFDHLSIADGLPENSVFSMLQDHLGLMWLGTQNGLVRYDGTAMTTFQYDPKKPYSLKGRQIRALYEDPKGDIWVGCESLFRYERTTGRFIEYPRKSPEKAEQGDWIHFIYQDRQGNIWTITSRNEAADWVLDQYNPRTNTWTYFRHNPAQPTGLAHTSVYLGGHYYAYNFSFGEDSNGKIWVVTTSKDENTLHWLDRNTNQFIRFKPNARLATAFKHIGVLAIVNQQLYLSSFRKGLFRLTPQTGQLEHFIHADNNPTSLRCDTVTKVHQSKNGVVWVATSQGLNRMNPKTGLFTPVRSIPADPTTPSPGLLKFLHEMPNGDLWFVTSQGLNLYDHQQNQFVRYDYSPTAAEGELKGEEVASFLVDKTGLVWAGTWNLGLNKQNRVPQFPLLTHNPKQSNGLQSQSVGTVYEAPSEPGIIWFGTGTGLDRLDKKTGQYSHYQHDSLSNYSLGKGLVTAIAEDKKGRFWVGTRTDGLYQMDRKTGRFTRFLPDLSHHPNQSRFQYVLGLLPAADGTLWLSNLYELDHLDVDHNRYAYYYKTADAYTPDLFTRLKPMLVPQRHIAAVLHPKGPIDQTVSFSLAVPTDLCVITGGNLRGSETKLDYGWIENTRGQILWEMTFENSKADSYSEQRIEVKTLRLPVGQYRLHYKSDDSFHYGSWPISPPIHAELWGVQLLRITAPERQQLDALIARKYQRTGLSDPRIFCLLEDNQGQLWTGSNHGGVTIFNPASNRFTTSYDYFKGPLNVCALLEDQSRDGFWVCDFICGLLFVDKQGKLVKKYTQANGLPSNTTLGIEQDAKGYLWVSTDNGLCRFDPQTEQFQTFSLLHGIQNGKVSNSVFRATDDELYVWNEKGVHHFSPATIGQEPTPPVLLTDLIINGQPATYGADGQLPTHISVANEIALPHDQNDLTFQFAALSYNRGNESQYAFKLSPNDTAWVPIGTTRQARFLDLQPGAYTFQVKAANANGVWNEKGTSIQVTIRPPWWQTWWAYLLYALGAGLLLRVYIAYRSQTLRRENQLLEEKVTLRTAEVQEQKEEIETQRDYLEATLTDLKTTQAQLIQKEKLASLGELTAGIAHEIQNPLNFVNNFSEVSAELIDELKEGPFQKLPDEEKDYAQEILGDLTSNLQKINHHGGRASSIVKGMLEHSRTETGEKRPTDLNALAQEYLSIAYHGFRAKDKNFNCELLTDFDPDLGRVEVAPQEIGRVLLNLYNNAFFAVSQRARQSGDADFKPTVEVTTKHELNQVVILVRDNGTGIAGGVKAKIFQPFFTTKPTGEGTGLGLSLSYDIITKGHQGSLQVISQEGQGAEFMIQLPA